MDSIIHNKYIYVKYKYILIALRYIYIHFSELHRGIVYATVGAAIVKRKEYSMDEAVGKPEPNRPTIHTLHWQPMTLPEWLETMKAIKVGDCIEYYAPGVEFNDEGYEFVNLWIPFVSPTGTVDVRRWRLRQTIIDGYIYWRRTE